MGASAPLVAEARANYEATQGKQIQQMAKQVASDTWRSMTGANAPPQPGATPPFRPPRQPPRRQVAEPRGRRYNNSPRPPYRLPYAPPVPWRRQAVRRASQQVARGYAMQARRAEAAARAAQRRAMYSGAHSQAGLSRGAVATIARYAAQARSAMHAAKVAQKKANKKANKKTKPANPTPAQVIAGAERDVVSSMHAVGVAAERHGMKDNSWHERIGGMIKNGLTAQASQAAQDYVAKRINQEVSSKLEGSTVDRASSQIKEAQKAIREAAARHAKHRATATKKKKKKKKEEEAAF